MYRFQKYFPYIILFSAVLLTIAAAGYSVYGLSKLFSGASIAVIIMASSLEFANIVSTTALKIYWDTLPSWLRGYLVIAVIVLSLITSAGIYGFLSDAYQKTADKDKIISSRIELLEVKKQRFQSQLEELKKEKESINISVENLRKSLSVDNQYQTIDKKTGQVLTQIQTTSKKGVQNQLDISTKQLSEITLKIDNLNDSISSYDIRVIDAKANNEAGAELGPLKYLSGLTGMPMDRIVNWFLILLVFVFQPLAIALVLTALFSFGKINLDQLYQPTSGFKFSPIPQVIEKEPVQYQNSDGFKVIKPEKKKRNPRAKKVKSEDEDMDYPKMFDIEIPGMKPLEDSKVVEKNITPDIADHIKKSLENKKKRG